MLRQSVRAAAIYVVGGIGLVTWSLTGFAAGAPREDWALMIVLPIAWIVSFWPMYGSLMLIWRIRSIQATLQRVADENAAGRNPAGDDLGDLEDYATGLAVRESRLPEMLVRPLVRRGIAHAVGRSKEEILSRPQEPAEGRSG